MLVTDSGMTTFVKEKSPSNTLSPIVVTLAGIATLATDLNANEVFPRVVTGTPPITGGITTTVSAPM